MTLQMLLPLPGPLDDSPSPHWALSSVLKTLVPFWRSMNPLGIINCILHFNCGIKTLVRCHHHEKEVLTAALERVSWHASEVMTVTGPSGVGKTTLVAGLQDHARRYCFPFFLLHQIC